MNPKLRVAAAVVLLLALAWLTRYEVVPVTGGSGVSYVYKLDRWTGGMEIVIGDQTATVQRSK